MPGGVCAVLDYEVDQMAEYVAEMATRLVMPQSHVTAPFRKFVSQILTSTRLPSTTILLGMNYLAKRTNMLSAAGPLKTTEGQVWRMLTIALLLGSKFLDDNTFQNRSWSEVSGIPVQELNSLEHEWLGAINWCLYVNLDKSKDYNAWLNSWQEWQENKKRQQAQASRERLAALVPPIETDVHSRTHPAYSSWHQQQIAEYERLSSMKRSEHVQQTTYRPHEAVWNQYQAPGWASAAPLTPPDSGYGTPEYMNCATSANTQYYGDFFNRAASNGIHAQRSVRQNPGQGMFHHSARHGNFSGYYNYGSSIWEHGIADCNCANCVGPIHGKPQQYFHMAPQGYGQPVMG
ncbi:putative cyclin-like protein [Phaeoacremonium minimum UCRPA7]|uniref:Putative cyclin-like protein n=1 Tax=Phaeoacremonium minimum (strain UCR-PA7) TaxID=1286976 RepID=R8BE63_PHAM7|nr:putative cyclin-like protein [Phaeoacremonium minimum UCRPA7]EON97599.1 putative cyclin-like protein [Phaeoacremonium minimum UCRPA7]